MSWTDRTAVRAWNIQLVQTSCSTSWAAPPGCLQHFTGTSGYIHRQAGCTVYSEVTARYRSYNYAGGLQLAGQQYTACIRTEQGYCSMLVTPAGDMFRVSGDSAASPLTGNIGQYSISTGQCGSPG